MPKFNAPNKDAYIANIQSKAEQEKQPTKKSYARDAEFYRFNLKMPIECKTYLQEMVWRQSLKEHRSVTITDYIAQLVLEDMAKHPEIMESIDELNT